MQKHKAEVVEERTKLTSQIDDLSKQLAGVDAELKAIEAYEKAHASKSSKTPADKSLSTRAPRGAKKQSLLDLLKTKPEGMTRGGILAALGAKGNKTEEQSISNTLATMAKAKELTNNDGTYTLPA